MLDHNGIERAVEIWDAWQWVKLTHDTATVAIGCTGSVANWSAKETCHIITSPRINPVDAYPARNGSNVAYGRTVTLLRR